MHKLNLPSLRPLILVYTATYSLGDFVLDYVQEQTEIGKQFPTPETIRERVQAFGARISGIVWVDKRYM